MRVYGSVLNSYSSEHEAPNSGNQIHAAVSTCKLSMLLVQENFITSNSNNKKTFIRAHNSSFRQVSHNLSSVSLKVEIHFAHTPFLRFPDIYKEDLGFLLTPSFAWRNNFIRNAFRRIYFEIIT